MAGPEPVRERARRTARQARPDRARRADALSPLLRPFAQYAEAAFLDELPPAERNRVLIRAAVGHLGTILEHSRAFYAGRDHDYFCAVTVTGWEYVDEGDVVIPHFWYANPSHGVFDHVRIGRRTARRARSSPSA